MAQFGNITNSGKARISSPFGPRNIGGRASRNHKGIDLSYPSGTQITSPLDGVIEKANPRAGNCGGIITINHGTFNGKNVKTKYCHVKRLDVEKGQQVKKGDIVGLSGGGKNDVGRGNAMGAHIHFEVWENGTPVNPKSYYENSISGEQSNITIPGETNTNTNNSNNDDDNDDDGIENSDDKTKSYKNIAKDLIRTLFGVSKDDKSDVTPDSVNEILQEISRYKELINEQVLVVDGASQTNTSGGTIYTSTNPTSEIRAFGPGGKIETLTDKKGYQNAIKVGEKYQYYWNGSITPSITTIASNGVLGKLSDGKLLVKLVTVGSTLSRIGSSSGSTSSSDANLYKAQAKSMAAGVLNTLVNGKNPAPEPVTENVKKDYSKLLEEELKMFKKLIK